MFKHLNSPSNNIIFFIHDLERGGPELRLLNFAKHFPSEYRIHVCVMSEELSLKNDFECFGAKVLVVPIGKVYLSFGQLAKISRYIKCNHIHIINVFDLKGLMISLFLKLQNIPHLKVVYHSVNETAAISARQKVFLFPILRSIEAVICNSHFSKTQIEKYIPESHISVIHNGVDLDFFQRNQNEAVALKSRLGINDDHIVLGTIANFRKQKNYPFLINGFEILFSKNQQLRLVCVGGGECLEEIGRLIKQRKLQEKIFLTGYTEKIKEHLNIIDVFVLTSLYEGLPNALLEAMAMGIPVISSSVGGCPEVIEHTENGLLFSANDIDKFVGEVRRIIDNESLALKLAVNARKTIENNFTLQRMVTSYLHLYNKISNQIIVSAKKK